jgi:hypothetical protein
MSKARGLADLGNAFDDGALSNRNLIINGAMQVAQRGTSATGVTSDGYRTCDRWKVDVGSSDTGAWTVSQASDGPEGFSKSMKVECTTAKTDISADWRLVNIQQRFEGQNMTQTKFGTANAESLTVSFWVKSNKLGTYTMELANENASYRLSNTFSVNGSGVWEKKTVTVAGDTTHGFSSDNTPSLYLIFFLAASPNLSSGSLNTTWSNSTTGRVSGSNVNLADTVGNYFQITGVQLEVGDTATPFENRSFGDELQRCMRYYYRRTSVGSNGSYYRYVTGFHSSTSSAEGVLEMPVEMRATPSLSSSGTFAAWDAAAVRSATTVVLGSDGSSKQTISLQVSGISGGTVHRPVEILSSNNSSSYLELSAEL